MNAAEVIGNLSLQPHPEGGWYREFHRSPDRVTGINGPRSCVTSIYYLLERGQFSRWHVVDADEIWHFYRGSPLQLYAYEPDGRVLTRHELCDTSPAAVIPRGCWQAARTTSGCSLTGCTVAPGFDFSDFRFVSDLDGHRLHFQDSLRELADLL